MFTCKQKGLQTDDVAVYPPASFLQQQFVAEVVREAGVGIDVAVLEDHRLRKNLIGILDFGSVGNSMHDAVEIEMVGVPIGEERLDGQPFHGRQPAADPKSLYGLNHSAVSWRAACHIATSRSTAVAQR